MGSCDKSGGFFAGLFGNGSSGGDSSTKCISCGSNMDDCSCNSALKDHLKKCCGLGTLPKLIEKCEETPGYRNPKDITTSSCGGGKCSSAPPPPKEETCAPPPEPKPDCSGGGGKVQCPPMPPTDCCNCKPAWMKCPPSMSMKTYAAPENDRILPLSSGGRMGGGCGSEPVGSKCGSCGTEKGAPAKPKISAGCPMGRPSCPTMGKKDDSSGGSFFSKIAAFFKNPDEISLCHRDVFDPSLHIRDDGYMCPLLEKVECAGNTDPCPEKPVDDCVEEVVEEVCEEEVEEICEEEVEVEEICEEEVVEEEICVEDEVPAEDCEDTPPNPPAEKDCCACCEELEKLKAKIAGEDEEEECVEDKEGECIEEETDECVEDECFEFEPVPNFNIKKASNCQPIEQVPGICPDCGGSGNECCSPQNKFVQRVVDPFADAAQKSCDDILKDMRTPKSPKYEEPKQLPVIECNPVVEVVEVNNNCLPAQPVVEKCVETPAPVVVETPPPPKIKKCKKTPPTPIVEKLVEIPAPIVVVEIPAPVAEIRIEVPAPDAVVEGPLPEPLVTDTCNNPPPPPEIPPQVCTPPCYPCGPASCNVKCEEPTAVYEEDVYVYESRPLNYCPCPASQQCPVVRPPPPPPPPKVEEVVEVVQVVEEKVCPPPPEPVVEQCAPKLPPCPCYKISEPQECPKSVEETPVVEASKPEETCAQPVERLPKCGSTSLLISQGGPPPTCADCAQLQNQTECPSAGSNDPIAKLVCACSACSDLRGCSPEAMYIPEWKPTPIGACPYCGAANRGDTDSCFICEITRKMRDPCYKEPECEEPPKVECTPEKPCAKAEDKCYSDKFDTNTDGTPKYEGGMCIQRALRFLSKANPRKNELESIGVEGQTFDGYGGSSSTGSSDCSEEDKKKYNGGMSINDAKEYIWGATGGK